MLQHVQALLAELEELALAMRERPRPSAEWAVRECIAKVSRAFAAHLPFEPREEGPGLFRSTERIVEAARLPAIEEDASDTLIEWLTRLPCSWECRRDGSLILHSPEGEHLARPGDWVVIDAGEALCIALPDECFRALYRAIARLNTQWKPLTQSISAVPRC